MVGVSRWRVAAAITAVVTSWASALAGGTPPSTPTGSGPCSAVARFCARPSGPVRAADAWLHHLVGALEADPVWQGA
jgi:hypothetical protein